MSLEQRITHFLQKYLDPERPVLIGLSGGPDSLTLLHLLLDFQKKHQLSFGIAHIDHGWRAESAGEAQQLQSMAHNLGVSFHLRTLDPKQLRGNLEAVCREERLKFFETLCKQFSYQAVLLGHQADDQTATVLKRLFEGAHLCALSGLQEVTKINDLTLWRPLLQVSKKEILAWMSSNGLVAFEDKTNEDLTFLRNRMRLKLIPQLTALFGKEIAPNLAYLAEEAHELKTYLDEQLLPILESQEVGPWGVMLDLTNHCPMATYAIKYLLRKFCLRGGVVISRAGLETASKLIQEGKGDKQVKIGQHTLYIDRKRLFFVVKPLIMSSEKIPLCIGTFQWGSWQVSVTRTSEPYSVISGWKEAWRGELAISLPEENYFLSIANGQTPYPGRPASIHHWWSNHKVPAFLRPCVPIIRTDEKIVHEFLSGRTTLPEGRPEHWLTLRFRQSPLYGQGGHSGL